MARKKSPQNPYIAGRVVRQGRGFFGRHDVFGFVKATLDAPDQDVAILYGQRRIGKTSVLYELEQRLTGEDYSLVYFDLMQHTRSSLDVLLRELALRIQEKAQIPEFNLDNLVQTDDWFHNSFLPVVRVALGNRQLVLLFDEFDVLDDRTDNQPSSIAINAFFPYLQQLIVAENNLQFVIVLGRKADELSSAALSALKSATTKRISVLQTEDALRLIKQAEVLDTLHFDPEVPQAILDLTSGHPFLTQLLCNVIFERAWAYPSEEIPEISVADVEASVPIALERGDNAFEWIWDGLPPAEKVVMAALATTNEKFIRGNQLMEVLRAYGVHILLRELEIAPDHLVKWELLRKEADGYTFFVELIRQWVAGNKTARQVKDELDNVEPLAKLLYESGEFYYQQNKLKLAEEQLRQVQQVNPNHLKAKLLLGEVLREQGQTAVAVHELEQAYRYDAEASRNSLLRALIVHGETLEDQNDYEGALAQYRRAYEILPSHDQTKHNLLVILKRQAREAENDLDFDRAKAYYEESLQVDPLDNKAKIDLERLQQDEWVLETLYTKAIGLTEQGRWDEALVVLRKLSNLDGAYRDVADKLGYAERQRKWQERQITLREFFKAFNRIPRQVLIPLVVILATISLIFGMPYSPYYLFRSDGKIIVKELHLREGPYAGEIYSNVGVIKRLPKNTTFSILGRTEDKGWLTIRTDSSADVGWIARISTAGDTVAIYTDLDKVPVFTPPPPPPARETLIASKPTPSPTPTLIPTSTFTPFPTSTTTPTPTNTPEPTSSKSTVNPEMPTETPSSTPTSTSTTTPTPTNTPTSTSTPSYYSAPILTGPDNGAGAYGTFPALIWQWDGELKENEYFEVRVWHESITDYQPSLGWVKSPIFDYNISGERHGRYFWSVVIVEDENVKYKDWYRPEAWPYPVWEHNPAAEAESIRVISQESEPRFFNFMPKQDNQNGGGGPISRPTPAGCPFPPC